MKRIFLACLCFLTTLVAKPNEFVCVHVCREAGLGYVLLHVFNLLARYDEGAIQGIKLNFHKSGCYYDPEYGENWWEYYFEPIRLGNPRKAKVIHVLNVEDFYKNNRKITEAYKKYPAMAEKYVRVKKDIQREVDLFVDHAFNGAYIIGVHYRGTDKKTEAERVSYEKVLCALEEKIASLGERPYKIFVATDEQPFLEKVVDRFIGRVFYQDGVRRSLDEDTPLHLATKESPYEVGRSALIDCLILSRVDFLFKTSSNLSDCSLIFNPKIPFEEVKAAKKI